MEMKKREEHSWEWEKQHLKGEYVEGERQAKERLRRMVEFVYRNPRILD